MKLIQRIKAQSTTKNRRAGKIATIIATTAGAVLATGVVVNPIGIIALTILSVGFGLKAGKHAVNVSE